MSKLSWEVCDSFTSVKFLGEIMEKWIQILNELTSSRISPRLEDRIYNEILVKGEQFKRDNLDEFSTGIQLFGRILMAHQDYGDRHGTFGDMFGDYLTQTENLNRRSGQFFTPQHIVEAMVKIIMDKADCKKIQRILDPAAGTGRFMLMTAKHYATTTGMLNFVFFNIDIDFTVYVYCTMNAILNGIPSVNIWGDSIAMNYREGVLTIPIGKVALWKMLGKEEVDVIMKPQKKTALQDFG